jgi:hypothetical protein
MNKDYTFGVITWIPKNVEDGNKYDDLLVRDRKTEEDVMTMANACGYKAYRHYDDEENDGISREDVVHVCLPVFSLGEILILDSCGREVAGRGRKPWKWSVEYAVFDDLDKAIECAQKVLSEEA